ncbi:MAG: glycosyltransferase family 2 protein [Ardenticatenaceae bacterium]|nr:glycosyltransferase family 2 protein [Ardenticatenaceae bacterium]
MQISLIIPVWYGQEVIGQCLTAVYQHATPALHEIICVDNGAPDNAPALIAAQFPQVRLLPQPVNLGFAGGVNAGMAAATGDVFVLLNQDCLVHEGWLTAVTHTFSQNPNAAILGGTLYNADGSVNHAGAVIQKPLGYGQHLTAVPATNQPQPIEYVTGALYAIRRSAWQKIGPMDEGFYPAYFEESDYCYRARQHGFDVLYVPDLAGTHLFSSRQWQKDPVRHNIHQHRARYRFISKHFAATELADFFQAETAALTADTYHDQTIGRFIAAQHTLRDLPHILTSRQHDLAQTTSVAHARHLYVGFRHLSQQAWQKWQQPTDLTHQLAASHKRLQNLRQQEYDILSRIYFRAPNATEPETAVQRLWRLIKRPFSLLTLRDYFLQAQLNTLHVARLDEMAQRQQLLEQQHHHHLRLLEIAAQYAHD